MTSEQSAKVDGSCPRVDNLAMAETKRVDISTSSSGEPKEDGER